jgi:hypothetical protein
VTLRMHLGSAWLVRAVVKHPQVPDSARTARLGSLELIARPVLKSRPHRRDRGRQRSPPADRHLDRARRARGSSLNRALSWSGPSAGCSRCPRPVRRSRWNTGA